MVIIVYYGKIEKKTHTVPTSCICIDNNIASKAICKFGLCNDCTVSAEKQNDS